jgi:hypothetical protein
MAQYDIAGGKLGSLAKFVNESASGKGGQGAVKEGGLATTLAPLNDSYQEINVVSEYPWTLSRRDEEIPYVRLREYKCVDSSIKKQLAFYLQLAKDTGSDAVPMIGALAGKVGGMVGANKTYETSLDVYTDIWPKDNPTGFNYMFPYFNKTGFELGSEAWTSVGNIGDSIKQIASGIADAKGGKEAAEKAASFGKKLDLIESGSKALLNMQYPGVGITDRPKMFNSHSDRTININFTLYNTINAEDWQKNRDLVYLLMSQNLFNKRDLTTGVPPVFYDVYIPGQYFSYASCMTNFKVDYLGNQRLLYDRFIVPDAYDVTISLTELVKPSKNQFESIQNGAAIDYVNVSRSINARAADAIVGAIPGAIQGAAVGAAAVKGAQIVGGVVRAAINKSSGGSSSAKPANPSPIKKK